MGRFYSLGLNNIVMKTSLRASIVGIISIIFLYIASWKPGYFFILLHYLGILKNFPEHIRVIFGWGVVLYYAFLFLLGLSFGYFVKDDVILYGLPVILVSEGLDFLELWAHGFRWQDLCFLLFRWGSIYIIVVELIIWLGLVWAGAHLFHFVTEKKNRSRQTP